MVTTKTKPMIGKRIIAGFVDYLIIYAFLFLFIYSFGEHQKNGGYSISGILSLIPIIFWAVFTIGWEQWFGATLGNSLVEIKPKSIKNKPNNGTLTFSQSLKRHLLDPIDMLFFGLIGILTIKNSEKHQRLGDIWANTVVVKIPKKN